MKKIICLLTVVSLLAAMSIGCSKEDTKSSAVANTPATASSSQVSSSETQSSETSASGVKKFDDLQGFYQVPCRNVVVNTPNWQEIEEAYTELFSVVDKKYIAFTGVRDSQATDLKEVLDVTTKKVQINLEADGYQFIKSYKFADQKEDTINGINVLRYEGTMTSKKNDTETYETYTVGYVFVMDGIPCNILGCVTDEEQPQELKDEIKKLVDEMIQTVRSEA